MIKIKTIAKNGLFYFVGTIVSAVLGILSTPLLTRILDPKTYAQYGILISFTTCLSTFIYLGQDEAFFRFYNNRRESYLKYFWICVKYPIVLLFFIIAILFFFPSFLNHIFEFEIALSTFVILCFYLSFLVVQRFILLTLRIEDHAINYAISNILTKGGFIVLVILYYCVYKTISFSDLILCLLGGVTIALIANIFVLTNLRNKLYSGGETTNPKDLLTFGLPLMISYTLVFAIPFLEKIVIRKISDWDTLALYTAAGVFITAINLIKTTVNSIWIPYVYKEYSHPNFKNKYHSFGILLTSFCVFIISCTLFSRRWLVLFFDSAYYDSMFILPAMVCGACFDLLTCVYSIGINISKKTKYQILFPITQICISLLFLLIFLPRLGFVTTGLSYLFSVSISRIFQISVASHFFSTGHSYVKPLIISSLGIIISVLSVFITSMFFDMVIPLLLLAITVFISHNECLSFIKNLYVSPSAH